MKDIRIEPIRYNAQATDLAAPDDAAAWTEIRDELRRLLSLAGDDGDWRSGSRNLQAVLSHYGQENIENRLEFERLIADAAKLLEPTR